MGRIDEIKERIHGVSIIIFSGEHELKDKLLQKIHWFEKDILYLLAKIERYEAALRFYAEKEKYDLKGTVTFVNGSSITLPEPSNIAEEALKEEI